MMKATNTSSRMPLFSNAENTPVWSRRQLLQAFFGTSVVGPMLQANSSEARPVKREMHLQKQFGNLTLMGMDALQPGDVLHLRVHSIFTSYHSVRKVINQIQHFMLTSASRSPKSVYYDFFHQYRQQQIPADDPMIGVDSDADTIRDLTDTGHSTIYIGDGLVVETTGVGAHVRKWANIDTARYVVMRGKSPALRQAILDFAKALADSVVAVDVKGRLLELSEHLPSSDAAYIQYLSSVSSKKYIEDKYDKVSGSKGFFGKLKVQFNLQSPTGLDTMIYHDRFKPPRLHRDTICSSLAALIVSLAERSLGWEAIGKTFDTTAMNDTQRAAFADHLAGRGNSVHVRPEHVLPAYLHMGMKLSNQYDIVGQFINIGSASNTVRTPNDTIELVRPHAGFIDVTRTFIDKLDAAQAKLIHLPVERMSTGFEVIGHGKLPHTKDLAAARAMYASLADIHRR
jgi:hypothetical protein